LLSENVQGFEWARAKFRSNADDDNYCPNVRTKEVTRQPMDQRISFGRRVVPQEGAAA